MLMPAECGLIIIFGVRSPDRCNSKILTVHYITAAGRISPATFELQGLKSFIYTMVWMRAGSPAGVLASINRRTSFQLGKK